MRKLLATHAPAAVLAIRLMVGVVFLSEGTQKFQFPADVGAGRFASGTVAATRNGTICPPSAGGSGLLPAPSPLNARDVERCSDGGVNCQESFESESSVAAE